MHILLKAAGFRWKIFQFGIRCREFGYMQDIAPCQRYNQRYK